MHSIQEEKQESKRRMKIDKILKTIGVVFMAVSVVLLVLLIYPWARANLGYQFSGQNQDKAVATNSDLATPTKNKSMIYPVDNDFDLIIPKIDINLKVIPEVDAFDSADYQPKLKQGIAHAKGSAFPNQNGRVFLFAHSGTDLLPGGAKPEFNLLDKLSAGDPVYLFYQGKRFDYTVTKQDEIVPKDVQFFGDKNELILMTCWPPGTTYQRLLITAERKMN